MKVLKFDHYYLHGELTETLKQLASEYPSLAKLTSAGKSVEGRDIWVMEITDSGTGPPEGKPAVWIDGNTHAGEPLGSMVCLKTISHLLSSYGEDPGITELLGNTTFYVLPRVDPDGGGVRPHHALLRPERRHRDGRREMVPPERGGVAGVPARPPP